MVAVKSYYIFHTCHWDTNLHDQNILSFFYHPYFEEKFDHMKQKLIKPYTVCDLSVCVGIPMKLAYTACLEAYVREIQYKKEKLHVVTEGLSVDRL